MAAKAYCQLGTLRWRIQPNSLAWSYQIDAAKIDTLGGQVVQVLGATLGDLTIEGLFGQTRGPDAQLSWQLAAEFQRQIKRLIDAQTLQVVPVKLGPSPAAPAHAPIPFRYHDDEHDWSFDVLIKSLEDTESGQLTHDQGKYSHGYRLTLFIVSGPSTELKQIAVDNFIARLADGVGWHVSKYNGSISASEAEAFIRGHGRAEAVKKTADEVRGIVGTSVGSFIENSLISGVTGSSTP